MRYNEFLCSGVTVTYGLHVIQLQKLADDFRESGQNEQTLSFSGDLFRPLRSNLQKMSGENVTINTNIQLR